MVDHSLQDNLDAQVSEDNWLPCLPWDGQEKSLPLGSTVNVKNLDPMKFLKYVSILDVEQDEGFRNIKPSELKTDDVILGTIMNEKAIKMVEKTYGPDWLRIKGADHGENYTREGWRDAFGTDGLELLAIRNLRYSSNGGKKAFQVGGK